MPFPTYKDSGGLVRSVKTVSSSAAGTNADPDIHYGEMILQNTVSTVNSSETNLGISGVFTGTGEDSKNAANVSIFVASDQSGTVSFQCAKNSADLTTAALTNSVSRAYTAGTAQVFTFPITAQFFRVVYTNGAVAQTSFRLSTILDTSSRGPVISELTSPLSDATSLPAERSIVTGRTSGGVYINVPVNAQGNLIVADYMTEVAKGNVPGSTLLTVHGYNPDSKLAVEEVVTDVGGSYTFPTSAGVITVSSSSGADTLAGTGAQTITFRGLNASYVEITETVNLLGATPVSTTATFLRFSEAKVATAGTGGKNAGTITASIGGNNQCAILPGANISQLGFYTITAGYTVYLNQIEFAMNEAATGETARGSLYIRPFGGIIILRDNYTTSGDSGGSSVVYASPIVITEKSDLYVSATPSVTTEMFIRLDALRVAN